MLTLSSPFYNKTEDQRLNLVKVIQLVSGWTEAESRISLIPSPAVLHCLPLSTHSLKQLAIFIHHRKGGNYAWPKANLTPPLSQLSGKNRQSWPSTPCPSNISTVSCFLKPKLSWVKHGLDLPSPLTSSVPTKAHLLPLRTREGQWGGRSQASPTGESLGPWVREGGGRWLKEALHPPLFPEVRTHLQKDRKKTATMQYRVSLQSHSKSQIP